jgi:phosphoserine phosphatase
MTFVATLISNPAAPALDAAAIERAHAPHSPSPQAPNWLDPGIAADIPFIATRTNSQVIDSRALADRVRSALAGAAIDVVVQPAGGRRKALFLADMDSTMIGQECIDELADHVGVKEPCRRHHRARDARRHRVRAGSARARGLAQGPCAPRPSTRSSTSAFV